MGAVNQSQNDGEAWIHRRTLLRAESRVRAGSREENSSLSRTKTQDQKKDAWPYGLCHLPELKVGSLGRGWRVPGA